MFLVSLLFPFRLCASKEGVERAPNITSAFEIGEMPTILDRDHRRVWNRLRNTFGDLDRDEVSIASDDQVRHARRVSKCVFQGQHRAPGVPEQR